MDFICPNCDYETEIDGEYLPHATCDNAEWVCPECNKTMNIGWTAEIEFRGYTEEH